MDERRGLKRLSRRQAGKPMRGEFAELIVNVRQKFIGRATLTV